jgi:hypothetical protein
MSFFGSLFGNDQRKDIEAANAKATGALAQGKTEAIGSYGQAKGYFDPYAQQGGRANALYGDATGANGVDAYRGAMSRYAGADPFRDQNADYANNALMRQYNARGMGNSGNASLAVARAQTERGAQDWGNYLQRLQGQGQQGLQATGAQAGLQQGIGDIQSGFGQQSASNAINYGNAMASSRNIGPQNMMGLAGLGMKAFAPAPGGSMASNAWGSINKLFG